MYAMLCKAECDMGIQSYLSNVRETRQFKEIDLITVLEAILTGRQTRLEVQCLNGNPMSNDFHKTSLLKNS